MSLSYQLKCSAWRNYRLSTAKQSLFKRGLILSNWGETELRKTEREKATLEELPAYKSDLK